MKSIQTKNIFVKLLGCVVFLSILVACSEIQASKSGLSETTTATLEPKVVLHENLIQVLGTDDRGLSRLIKIAYSVPEKGDITITWAINADESQNLAIANAQIDATNILKVLQNSKVGFVYVIIIGTFTVQDKDGNMIETQAINLGFNKSKLDNVNWEDFQPSNIYDLADISKVTDEWK